MRCGNRLEDSESTLRSIEEEEAVRQAKRETNPLLVILGVVGVLFIIGIVGSALSDDADDGGTKATPTPAITPDWRTFMDDRDVTLLSSGIMRLGRRYDVQLDEYKVRRFIAQNATDKLAEESGWQQFWLWLLTVLGGFDEHDVANDLEDAIYDEGEDVREFLESFEACCAANR